MADILIFAGPRDGESIHVHLALALKGVASDLWFFNRFPQDQLFNLALSSGAQSFDVPPAPDLFTGYRTVWNRRPTFGPLPPLHPDDVVSSRQEINAWRTGFHHLAAGPDTVSVNPIDCPR